MIHSVGSTQQFRLPLGKVEIPFFSRQKNKLTTSSSKESTAPANKPLSYPDKPRTREVSEPIPKKPEVVNVPAATETNAPVTPPLKEKETSLPVPTPPRRTPAPTRPTRVPGRPARKPITTRPPGGPSAPTRTPNAPSKPSRPIAVPKPVLVPVGGQSSRGASIKKDFTYKGPTGF